MEGLVTLILAAGLGKRMKSKHPKVVHKVCGKPMIEWVVDAVEEIGSKEVIVVVGHKAEEVKEVLKERVKYAYQEVQLGTGHAVMMAEDLLPEEGNVLILTGDTPLITSNTLKELINFHIKEGNSVTILSSVLEDPTGYGRIIRDKSGNVIRIVEDKDATEEEKSIHEINSAMYVMDIAKLKKALRMITNNNAQGEYYLTDAVEIIRDMDGKIGAFTVPSEEITGVNSRVQLFEAEKIMRKRINYRHMENGVTIVDPDTTYIGAEVEIGADTVVLPGCVIEGKTKIGSDCEIGPNCRIVDSEIGDGCSVTYSVILSSKIKNNVKIGPFAHIRPETVIQSNVKIGDFVEIKKSIIDEGSKVPHLTYVGDAEVGKNVNMGCGSITVNYDGKQKHKTVIGDNVFVGCNVNLVAPVKIGNNAYIAAGSTITEDVPEGALAIARSRQTNKEGWVQERIKKGGFKLNGEIY
ncbi:bifunctional UDP-N-acetylglucosamine diphosphorylase/glucosamine-1-phosphate N-acetyltransferase GlmU [Thermoanaerobacter sp. RKWS2]|uniref:bifunctional UDP-N-acetylglucosamine diphosphorylase/glucosamine-1-phosphate N-acetyltransferase GlmU n=1 Tax=Thermoanaerobacter sp. RKWS2 TaxID=2983842 RepID=UPI002B05E9FF|nr:bifunctional UDP-N-acetylglucosamine diphosphorylase/glucosamine-1-phosphate N-acetyltransferase GlmU [Thermoanaerobacter sp. RKWS2]